MKKLTRQLCVHSLLLVSLVPSFALAQSLTIQGKVTDSNGQPVNGSNTQFRVQILAPDTAGCVLYDESFTVDLSASFGLFSLNLNAGAGTRNAPSTYTLEQAISNRATLSTDAAYCKTGSGTVAYSPSPNDKRRVLIKFRDPAAMPAEETIPEMDLNPVAYAMESRTVGGFPASSVLRVQDASGPMPAASFSSTQFADLQALVGGTSTKYMVSGSGSSEGARLPTASGRPSAPAAGSVWFDTASGTVKYFDGSADRTVGTGTGSGTITGVTAGTGLSGGGATGTVTLALSPSGVGAGGSFGSATQVPQLTVDTYGRITGVSLQTISGTVPGAGASGQVLRSDGTSWISDVVRTGDIRSTSDNATIFPAASCTAGQSLGWDSVSDKLVCQTISLPAPSATVAASYTKVNVAADGRVNGGSNPTTLAGYGITDALDRNGGIASFSAGNTAGRPAAGTAGRLYVDTQALTLYRDNGATWDIIGSAGAGGSLTGVTAGTGLSGGGSSGNVTVSMPNVGTAGTYFKVTTDAQGRVSSGAASLLAADIPNLDWAKIATGKPTTLAGYGITDSLVSNSGAALSLAAGNTSARPMAGTLGRIYIDTQANMVLYDTGSTWQTIASASGAGGDITDVTAGTGLTGGGASGAVTLSMPNVGTAGTYPKVTTDAQGRVTAGTALVASDIPALDWAKITTGKPTDLSGYGITDTLLKNSDGTVPNITSGLESALPAPSAANLNHLYIANNTKKIFRQIAGTWEVIAAAPGSGFTGSLAGEVSGTQGATQVDSINGMARTTIISHLNTVGSATEVNTATTLVKRDASGNFAAGAASLGSVVLRDSGSNTATLRAPATITSSYTLRLPAAVGAANQVLTTDASGNLSWSTPAVTSGVAVTAPITNTGTAAAPNIGIQQASGSQAGYLSSADWNTFSNKLSTALNSALIWVGNGSNVATPVAPSGDVAMTNAGAFTVNGIKGQAISATGASAGQVLRYAGANTWTPNFVGIRDLRSNVTGSVALPTTCTASQTLTWDSALDNLTCQSISIAASTQITGVLPIANGGTGANSTSQNFVFAGPASGGAGAPSFRALAASDLPASASYWTAATGGINYAGGNVGIGSTAPASKLDVAGDIILNNNFLYFQKLNNGTTDKTAIGATTGGIASMDFYSDDRFRFFESDANAELFTILGNTGLTGIGTSNPLTKLHVYHNGASSIIRNESVGGIAYNINYRSGAASGDVLARFEGRTTEMTDGNGAAMQMRATQAPGATASSGAAIDFLVRANGAGDHAMQMTLDQNGRLGIGTSAPQAGLDVKTTATASAIIVPRDTVANRPSTGVNGMIRYASDTNVLEAYVNGAWASLATIGGTSSFATVNAGAGSAGAPSLSFSGDTDTGFYNASSNNVISVAAGGAKIFDFSSAGLSSPTTGAASVLTANGSAAAPTFSFAGDLDTGWFRPGADTLAASTAGTERMRIDATGKVGVGTTTPVARLTVSDASLRQLAIGPNGSQWADISSAGGGAAFFGSNGYLNASDNTFRYSQSHNLSGGIGSRGLAINYPSWGDQTFVTSNGATTQDAAFTPTALMTIKAGGNVGIGTTNPGYKAEVQFTGDDGLRVKNTGSAHASLYVDSGTGAASYLRLQNAGIDKYWLMADGAGDLSFRPSGGTASAIFKNNGSVGIGTTAPSQTLQVNTTGTDHTPVQIGSGAGSLFLTFNNPTVSSNLRFDDGVWRYETAGAGSLLDFANGNFGFRTAASGAAGASTSPSEVMTILANGNVGIGTTGPTDKLQVNGNLRLGTAVGGGSLPGGGSALIFSGGPAAGDNSDPMTIARYDLGSDKTEMRVQIGDNSGYDPTFNDAFVVGLTAGSWIPYLRVESGGMVAINRGTDATARFAVTGNAGQHAIVGNTNDTGSTYYGVYGQSGSYFGALGRADGYAFVGTGNVWATGNGMFNQSDARYKEHITPLNSSLSTILKLRPVSYTWKKDSEAHKSTGDKPQFGLIAQEVQKVIPDIVIMNHKPPSSPNKDGSKTLDEKLGESLGVEYTKIIPFLIGAVQELKAQVDGIFQTNKADHEELQKVKAENAELKAYLCAKDPSAPFCAKAAGRGAASVSAPASAR